MYLESNNLHAPCISVKAAACAYGNCIPMVYMFEYGRSNSIISY